MHQELIGLPVPEALALAEACGAEYQVIITKPPRPAFDAAGRTLRVTAVRQGKIIAAYFRDGDPAEMESACP